MSTNFIIEIIKLFEHTTLKKPLDNSLYICELCLHGMIYIMKYVRDFMWTVFTWYDLYYEVCQGFVKTLVTIVKLTAVNFTLYWSQCISL